jgi:hypothetical protein
MRNLGPRRTLLANRAQGISRLVPTDPLLRPNHALLVQIPIAMRPAPKVRRLQMNASNGVVFTSGRSSLEGGAITGVTPQRLFGVSRRLCVRGDHGGDATVDC